MHLTGLHHTSMYSATLSANLAFYTEVLGLRLVMRSVNQDNPRMYHLAYGDALGQPGTLLTFFDMPKAAPRRPRRNDVSEVALGVLGRAALDYWSERLADAGVSHSREAHRGRASLSFTDPDGQHLSLVDMASTVEQGTTIAPWTDTVPAHVTLQGLFSVTLTVERLEPTAQFFSEALNLVPVEDTLSNPSQRKMTFRVGTHQEVRVVENPDLPKRGLGAGSVHHVAFGVAKAELPAWQERLASAGYRVSDVIDRHYAAALYVREPNGVLIELSSDEFNLGDPAHLGERLLLPPRLEPQRAQIERALRPLSRADEDQTILRSAKGSESIGVSEMK